MAIQKLLMVPDWIASEYLAKTLKCVGPIVDSSVISILVSLYQTKKARSHFGIHRLYLF